MATFGPLRITLHLEELKVDHSHYEIGDAVPSVEDGIYLLPSKEAVIIQGGRLAACFPRETARILDMWGDDISEPYQTLMVRERIRGIDDFRKNMGGPQ